MQTKENEFERIKGILVKYYIIEPLTNLGKNFTMDV